MNYRVSDEDYYMQTTLANKIIFVISKSDGGTMDTVRCGLFSSVFGKYKNIMEEHEETFQYCNEEETLIGAVKELWSDGKIDFFDGDKETESDCYTSDIRWSEFEDRTPEEILNEDEDM